MQTIRERRAYHKAYYQANKPLFKARMRQRQLGLYGLTQKSYDALLAYQEKICAICGSNEPNGKRGQHGWHIDHDHKTGRVRALLCRRCNFIIGQAKESIPLLHECIRYLEAAKDVNHNFSDHEWDFYD